MMSQQVELVAFQVNCQSTVSLHASSALGAVAEAVASKPPSESAMQQQRDVQSLITEADAHSLSML